MNREHPLLTMAILTMAIRTKVHRDVKPENILFVSSESSDMKLIDFGYAGLWREDKQLTGLCGTPDYVAPEV
jgi:calcium/calmodulin-dependent protein kinase I